MSKQIESHGMRDTAVGDSAVSGSWDPYEVWLNRVKKPREDQAFAAQSVAPMPVAKQLVSAAQADLSETQRLRTLAASG